MFESLAEVDRLVVPREVRDEITDTGYTKWLDGLGVVHDLDEAVSNELLKLMAGVGKRMVDFRRSKNGADPVVIAFAKAMGGSVVTSERSAPKSTFVKIPDACAACNVPCLTVLDFFRAVELERVHVPVCSAAPGKEQSDLDHLEIGS